MKCFLFVMVGVFLIPMGCSWSRKSESTIQQDRQFIEESSEPLGYFKEGIQLMDKGKKDGAILAFQKALKINPDIAVIHNNVAVLFKQKEMFEKAQEHYQKAIGLDPDNAEVHNNLGILYREMGKFQDSEKEYLEAIRVSGNFAPAYFNLGILYDLYLNQPEDAILYYIHYLKRGGKHRSRIEGWILELEQRLDWENNNGKEQD
ncbi:MAG TPA: tetratricopeptide repeat protein [Nitrospiria bacterium]